MEDGIIVCTEELIKYIFKKQVLLESIGHKELGRNAVYYVPEHNLILKLYGEKIRWGREVASLRHLKGKKDLCAPEMLDYGIFREQTYWLLTRKLSGINLTDIIYKLDKNQRLDIYKEIGYLQARFHKECRVNIFGDWDVNGEILEQKKSYFSFAKDKNDNQSKRIISKGYPDTNLFMLAAEKLILFEHIIKDCNIFSLCHNDFIDRNILVENINAKWEITGIIDFERCYPSDPESDFSSILLDIYMKKEMDYFLSGYAEICTLSNGFHEKIIYYLMAFCLEVCSWSYKVAPDYYNKSKKMLEYLVNSSDSF
jgi:fructosamine-3-kinase